MYILIVYDINTKNVSIIHNFLRTHLTWIQNSVFEGEVTKAQYNTIKEKLNELVDYEKDSIIIYEIPKKYVKKSIIGIEKNNIDFII
ncbi:CRISPR-associated endonuclease Cas2 [Methanosphaera sp. Vir-13MRS]|uniref:CRISPR-associated endonuclease Cas2 n=1 Tax=Candidatus Methanosphaera massiliense TaxID=3017187 RepID=UPI002380A9FF|nr:CRISPR-associated endonuclease Cas2 [Candidatus Methanosphaera massiliense]MDE4078672.1 CRISPR-associated endonuclease Cas2 [Candidatus Methanosphaera massiliense]